MRKSLFSSVTDSMILFILIVQSLVMLLMVMPVCVEEQSHCEGWRHSINQESR